MKEDNITSFFDCVIIIKGGYMETIYLISSNSYRLIEDEVLNIVNKNPYTTFDLNSISIEEVLEEAAYFSLFQEKKYLLVKNANLFGTLKKKNNDENEISKKDLNLLKYLEEPNPNTILIFTINGKIDSKKKICKIIKEKHKLIQIDDLKPKDIYTKVEKDLKANGFKCDYNTIYYIINNCQNNYDLVMNEIDKIKLYYGKGTIIKQEDVSNIISRNIEDNNFKFIDTVLSKNIKETFRIFDDLMLQKVEPLMLIVMLSKEFRNLLLVKKLAMQKSKKELMNILGINYDFQIDKLINNSYSFKEKELTEYLTMLCDLDYKIKTGKISNKLALEMFLLHLNK